MNKLREKIIELAIAYTADCLHKPAHVTTKLYTRGRNANTETINTVATRLCDYFGIKNTFIIPDHRFRKYIEVYDIVTDVYETICQLLFCDINFELVDNADNAKYSLRFSRIVHQISHTGHSMLSNYRLKKHIGDVYFTPTAVKDAPGFIPGNTARDT